MKKIISVILSIVCLSLCLGLFGCSDKESNDKTETDTTIYSVTIEKSDYFSFAATMNATAGTNATVKLTSNFPAYEIIGCTFNGKECTKTSAEEAETKEFSYVMPHENVEIKVINRWKDIQSSGYENFLSFSSTNTYTASSAFGDDTYDNDINWGDPLVLDFDTDVSFMTVAKISAISANEEVVPNSAITVQNTLSKNSNSIVGGKIIIDRSKAKVGTTQIVLRVKNENALSYDGIIVATVTITE